MTWYTCNWSYTNRYLHHLYINMIYLKKLEALNKYIHVPVYILDKYLKINFAPCHVKLQHHIIMEEFFLAIKKLMLHWLVDAWPIYILKWKIYKSIKYLKADKVEPFLRHVCIYHKLHIGSATSPSPRCHLGWIYMHMIYYM
jgi:hypothetical protein